MPSLAKLRATIVRVAEVFRRKRIERELDEELAFHLECEIAQRVARGTPPDVARREAMLAFGGVQRFREEAREARGVAILESFFRDLRYAARRLLRAPSFAIGTTATLGIGLGVAAAIGALVYGVMLRPLPYLDSSRLVRVSLATPGLGVQSNDQSSGTYLFLADHARSYTALGAYFENSAVSITEGDAPERVSAALMTPSVLEILRVKPAAGRLFDARDAAQDFTSPVMISFDLWQRRFAGDPTVVGRYIELNRAKRLIVGVLPRGFAFPSPSSALYYPIRLSATHADLAYRSLSVIGRLASGVSAAESQREIDALLPRIGEQFPEIAGAPLERAQLSGRVETLRDATIAPIRVELRLLGALVFVVMLIVFANVLTLALLRAERMQAQVSVMRALGASASAVRQRFVAETLVTCVAGGAIAIPITAFAVATKFGVSGAQIPRLDEVAMSPRVVVAIVATAICMGLLLGIVMSARTTSSASNGLRVDARITSSRKWRRAQQSLVAVQIALAMSLLLNAGLFAASMVRLRDVDLGFVADERTQFSLQIPFRGYETYQRTAAFDLSVVDALRRSPGIEDVAAAMELPSTPQLLGLQPTLQAAHDDGRESESVVRLNVVSPGFFRLMGIPLRRGRTFETGDLSAVNPGVVLSAALAHDLFGDEDPIGRTVSLAHEKYPAYRVVGVSGDVYGERVTDGVLREVYYPLLNDLAPSSKETEERIPIMPGGMRFVVRSALPVASLTPIFRAAVHSVDTRVPVWGISTLDDIVAATTARLRLSMLLLAAAALATLLLGAIGIYSVVAYTTAGRAPELAVRLALGASPERVLRFVYVESASMAVVGIGIGVVLALTGARIVRGLLYEVNATDLRLVAASVGVILLVNALAVSWPARRAARIDPATVLRG